MRLDAAAVIDSSAAQPPTLRNAVLLSLLNQVISSGGNFALSVYLARGLSLRDYGVYGICYGVCMLYVGIGNAMILTQMLVNMAEIDHREQSVYASRMLLAVLLLGWATLLLMMIVLPLIFFFAPQSRSTLPTVLAVAAMAILFLCKEFFIRYAYIMRIERLAVCVSGLTVGLFGVGLLAEHLAGIRLTVNHVLVLSAASTATGALTGYCFSPLHVMQDLRASLRTFVASWHHARWALGGVLVTWIQSQTYTYVLAALLGPAGVGQANAARIFISPFSFLLPALNQIALPRLAELRLHCPQRLMHVAMMLTLAMLMLAVVYAIVLLHGLPMVADLVLGRHDPAVQSLVWIWCVVMFNQMILNGGSTTLQVLRRFRILTLLNMASAAVAVGSALLLVQLAGAPGAIWAVAVGEILLSILVWREIRRQHGNPG